MASKQKTGLVSWGVFFVGQKALPKTLGPDTVVKLWDGRGLNNSILDGGPKKKKGKDQTSEMLWRNQSSQEKLQHSA